MQVARAVVEAVEDAAIGQFGAYAVAQGVVGQRDQGDRAAGTDAEAQGTLLNSFFGLN